MQVSQVSVIYRHATHSCVTLGIIHSMKAWGEKLHTYYGIIDKAPKTYLLLTFRR